MRQSHRLLAGLLAAGALLTAGCAQSVDPIERLGRKAARQVTPGTGAPRSAAHRRWGPAGPLARAPEPPARKASAAISWTMCRPATRLSSSPSTRVRRAIRGLCG